MSHYRSTMDHAKADPDMMGASRRGGGGFVLPNFQDTLGQPRVDNRDPRIRHEQAPRLDLRHARRSKVGIDDEMLLDFASATASRVAFNRQTQPIPDLKRDLRVEANRTIQNYNRTTQAELLRLAQADLAGADEQAAVSGVCAKLLRLLEHPERTIWLVDRSFSKRGTRCIPDVDQASAALVKERALAVRWQAEIQHRYTESCRISQALHNSRKQLAAFLKERKRGMDLMPDAYSGVVTGYPVPIHNDPQCVTELSDVYQTSQQRRAEDESFIQSCTQHMSDMRESVQAALAGSVARSKEQQRLLVLAAGQNRLAANRTNRNLHLLDIQQRVNEGVHEGNTVPAIRGGHRGKFETTSEAYDRPLVNRYNRATEHHQHVVTAFEESRLPFDTFERSKVLAADDGLKLEHVARAVSATLHDRTINRKVDSEVSRLRTKLKPGRRHGIHG